MTDPPDRPAAVRHAARNEPRTETERAREARAAGEKLHHAGDDSLGATAGNIIHCRCTEASEPRGCQPEAKTYDERSRIWKRLIIRIEHRERMALRATRSIFRTQRADVLRELTLLAGAA